MARTNLTALAAPGAARPGNKALAERKKTEALIAENAQAREDYVASGLPSDWLNSGIAGAGVGWLFGPVPGLLGAAVTALLGKRRRSGIAARASADAKTGQTLIEGGAKSIARLEAAAVTDQDKLEAELLRNQYEQAVTVASSANPQVSAQGFASLLSIPGLASDEADEIEAAQLEREQLERDRFDREADQAVDLRNRLESESRTFVDAERQFRNLQEILSGDPSMLDATTAIFTFAKLVNPGEITTEGDIQSLSAGGGVSQALASRLNEVILGRAFLDETIKGEMLEAGKDLMRTQRSEQIQRNQFARDFGEDLGIRPQLLENVLIPINTRPDQLVPLKQPNNRPPTVNPNSPAQEVGGALLDTGASFFGIDTEDDSDVFTFSGKQYRRVDRGDGRFEWQPLDAEDQPGAPGFLGRDLSNDVSRRREDLRNRRRSVNE